MIGRGVDVFTLATLIVSLSIGLSCRSDAAPAAKGQAPALVKNGGRLDVRVPDALRKSAERNFPGYRLLTAADVKGPWLDTMHPDELPFITWGDYRGTGSTDVATFVVKEGSWKLVVFHQQADGSYEPVVLDGEDFKPGNTPYPPPNGIFVRTLKKGEQHLEYHEDATGEEKEKKVVWDRDGLVIDSEGRMTFTHWNGKSYESYTRSLE
jgi:hypothetical protein